MLAEYLVLSTDHRHEIVKGFCEECVWAHSIRTHFADLVEQNEKRRELLSEVASMFFGDLNLLLIEYIILQKCKLQDPVSDRKKSTNNLTTNYILELNWSIETKSILEAENKRLMNFRKRIVDARNKLVSHLDLKTRLQPLGLGSFTQQEEQDFWSALQAFANAAHEEALGSPYPINAAMQEGDVASLVHYLRDGVDYDDLVESEDGFLLRRIKEKRFDRA